MNEHMDIYIYASWMCACAPVCVYINIQNELTEQTEKVELYW